MTITKDEIRDAAATLERYRAGRALLEGRLLENRRVWRRITQSVRGEGEPEATTAWLFNCIANKHADAMDNFPEACVLAREDSDRGEAQVLSAILPLICEHSGYEGVYSDLWWSKLIGGTAVTGVFWDNTLNSGAGDIALREVDLLSIFWEPGVRDIQSSRNVFTVESVPNDELCERWPQLEGKLGGERFAQPRYAFDESIDTSDRSSVVDWYYKRAGKLHFCKFVNDELLYSSENDPRYSGRGWYDHGRYPFVFDAMYPDALGLCGFGAVDVTKNAQSYIDRLNSVILKNALASSRVRYFVRSDGGVSEAEFADTKNELVHVSSSALGEDSIRQIVNKPLGGIYSAVLQMKIDELKETSGNRDFTQGSTNGGVTSGTAIAALQEAGNKLSRDVIGASYRAFEKVNYMMIELVRQFYSRPRTFRILGPRGAERFVSYDNSGIAPAARSKIFGLDEPLRLPVFDIRVYAQKASPFSREVRNERAMQLYSAGFFKPEMRSEALCALEMMDFEGKSKIMRAIAEAPAPLSLAPARNNPMSKLGALASAAVGYDAKRRKLRP